MCSRLCDSVVAVCSLLVRESNKSLNDCYLHSVNVVD